MAIIWSLIYKYIIYPYATKDILYIYVIIYNFLHYTMIFPLWLLSIPMFQVYKGNLVDAGGVEGTKEPIQVVLVLLASQQRFLPETPETR